MIGKRIRQLREQKGLSQGDVEKASGLLRCYISRVEHGHTVPSLGTLERLASALDVPFYQLFCNGDGDPANGQTSRRTLEELADEAGPSGADARFLLKLKGLAGKMTDANRGFLIDFARRLSSSVARDTGGPDEGRTVRKRPQPPQAESV